MYSEQLAYQIIQSGKHYGSGYKGPKAVDPEVRSNPGGYTKHHYTGNKPYYKMHNAEILLLTCILFWHDITLSGQVFQLICTNLSNRPVQLYYL
jgi:hypothetical protein